MRLLSSLVTLSVLLSIAPAATAPHSACNAPLPAKDKSFTGEVTFVASGHVMCVGRDLGGIAVRLADFNAPEPDAPGGQPARATLSYYALGKTVACQANKHAKKHVVALCTVNGRQLGDLLRAAGIPEVTP
jgi:hypothetical protein